MQLRRHRAVLFTLIASITLIASVRLGPVTRADQHRTLIRNASLVLTMDPTEGQGDLGLIADADILVVGDTIAAVGKRLVLEGADVLDATGKIVMPGFVDTHNHLWQSLIRGCGTGSDVNGWLAAAGSSVCSKWARDLVAHAMFDHLRHSKYAQRRLTTSAAMIGLNSLFCEASLARQRTIFGWLMGNSSFVSRYPVKPEGQ